MTDRSRAALRWLLLGSIGLNIALAAALVLPHTGWLPSRDAAHAPRLFAPMALRKVLTHEQRKQLRTAWSEQRPQMREKFGEARQARRRLDTLLRQPTVNRVELEAVMADVRGADAAAIEAMHRMITDTLLQLDAEQRARLADTMAKPRRRDRDRDHDDERGNPGQRDAAAPALSGEAPPA